MDKVSWLSAPFEIVMGVFAIAEGRRRGVSADVGLISVAGSVPRRSHGRWGGERLICAVAGAFCSSRPRYGSGRWSSGVNPVRVAVTSAGAGVRRRGRAWQALKAVTCAGAIFEMATSDFASVRRVEVARQRARGPTDAAHRAGRHVGQHQSGINGDVAGAGVRDVGGVGFTVDGDALGAGELGGTEGVERGQLSPQFRAKWLTKPADSTT